MGLRLTSWPGRSQTLRVSEDVTFFLDGAHTKESLEACADWFDGASLDAGAGENGGRLFRVLVFQVTKDRKGEELVATMAGLDFDLAVFCTTQSRRAGGFGDDNTNFNTSVETQV